MYPGAPQDPFQQAEGVRYLSRLTRAALEAFVEYGDVQYPQFKRLVHETVKLGADNPDNYYVNAQISGEFDYRITGRRNTIHYIGFFTQNGDYGSTGGMSPCGVLEGEDLVIDEDGNFEIILSNSHQGDNWLRTDPETGLVIVRQTFLDRSQETPADLKIEMINGPDHPHDLTAHRIDEGLKKAGLFVSGAPMLFAKWAKGFQSHTNELPLFDPEVSNAMGGDANILYYHSHWKLGPDEALVIEAQIPECDMWNFQLNNYWMESLDYRYFNICINSGNAIINPEGTSVKVVVAHSDPGVPNWINTAGHSEGTMCWRWYRPHTHQVAGPVARVVNFAELKNHA